MAKEVDIGAYSAYAIAVKHGYSGTEAEWIAETDANRAASEAARDAAQTSAAAAESSANSAAQDAATATAAVDRLVNMKFEDEDGKLVLIYGN